MLRFTVIALTAILFSGTAFASSECDDAQDQATMTKCANDELSKADKHLNANYHEIEKRLADDEEAKKLLITSQRAWVKFRDAECNFSTSATVGGSIHPMMIASCRAQITTDRNKQFTDYLNCPEGDLSCPVPSGG
ncbi:lysozyme inhibitor LprI family protein [Brucella gallinifaecis]|uniref:lysozyme inhibitor LprI family protein n=1 Tax=Brucella gallinifaecis TaxID=215590 RepID=UPI00235EB24F|nr:lysozyme inhibitor LprI family protein [Brucella gallinifaecis]